MPLRPEDLPDETEALRALVLSLSAESAALKAAIKQINLQVFGPRSERSQLIIEGQMGLELGDQPEAVAVPTAEVIPFQPVPRGKRKPARRNIGQLPDWLPRVVEVIEPQSISCACCRGTLHKIGEDIAEALDVVPARVRVLRTVRPKYACRACESGITQAPARPRLFDGGMATTGLVASIAVWKYAWHMPLSRQVDMLAGQGIRLDRATFQFHASSRCSSCALTWPLTIRSSASLSQTRGSISLSRAVISKEARMAQVSAPPSSPA
jgi:transposase